MKLKLTISMAILFLAQTISILATNVNGRLSVLNTDSLKLTVIIQINTNTGYDDMGGATIVLGFDHNKLNFSSNPHANCDYIFHNFSGGNYNPATITKPAIDRIWLNIDLPFNNSNNGTLVSGGNGWTDVATVFFDIITPNDTLELSWHITNPYWGIYDANNTSLWSPGTFINVITIPLPVELTSFTAKTIGKTILLKWQTATEINNFGFEIQRQSRNEVWEQIGFVEGNGNSNSPKDYSFIDKNSNGVGEINYRLKQIDNDGQFEYSDEISVNYLLTEFELFQNYPNPFNPSTTISWQTVIDGNVSIKIYDILGNEIAEILNEFKSAGRQEIVFESSSIINGLTSGVYIYKIEIENNESLYTMNKKMILLK